MSLFNKNEIIEMAVEIEKQGYIFYDNALKRKDLDEETRGILLNLRDEEKKHEALFLSLRNRLDDIHLKETFNWEEINYFIQTTVYTHVFSEPGKGIEMATKAKNSSEVISYAIGFEKDTLLFFYTFKQYVKGKKAEEAIEAIIAEEIKHVLRLRKLAEQIC